LASIPNNLKKKILINKQNKVKESEREKRYLKEGGKKMICWVSWCENELMLQKSFC
jgi:hypothetical protein